MFSNITLPHLYHCTLFTPTFAPRATTSQQGLAQIGDHEKMLQQMEDRRRREAMSAAEEIALRERQHEDDIRNPPKCHHIQRVFLCGHSTIIHTPSCAGPSTNPESSQCVNSADISVKVEAGADCAVCDDARQKRERQRLEAQEWEDWVDVENGGCAAREECTTDRQGTCNDS